MQINSLLPALLQLILSGETGRENKQPASRQGNTKPPSAQPMINARHQIAGRVSMIKDGMHQSSEALSSTGNESGNLQNELILLPLPLKSEMFPNAKFYKQVADRERRNKDEKEQQHRVVFGLRAPSLGDLYFVVTQRETGLSIKCAAASNQAVQALKERLDDLQQKLNDLGWEKINLSCVRVENPEQLPGITPSDFIDLRL